MGSGEGGGTGTGASEGGSMGDGGVGRGGNRSGETDCISVFIVVYFIRLKFSEWGFAEMPVSYEGIGDYHPHLFLGGTIYQSNQQLRAYQYFGTERLTNQASQGCKYLDGLTDV